MGCCVFFFFFKQKTAYEMRISDWSSDVCSSDLTVKGIVAKYPKDVRLVMRYLPLHPGSAEAIVILEAARVQGKLDPVPAALLEAQPAWHDGKLDGARAAPEKAARPVAEARPLATADAMAWRAQTSPHPPPAGSSGPPRSH